MMTFKDFARRYPEYKEELEERAAIMEHDGCIPREVAEEKAVLRVLEKIERQQTLFENV